MDIRDILSVGLTPEDFDLLLKGLDAIPESEGWSQISKDLMLTIIAPTGVHMQERLKKLTKNMEDLKRNQEKKKEDFIVLKSKLILLKRLLLTNDAVKEATSLVSTPPLQNR